MIHRAGYKIIFIVGTLFLLLTTCVLVFISNMVMKVTIIAAALLMLLFIIRFFRVPSREKVVQKHEVLSPADGTVVAIEEVFEDEVLNGRCMQVSIFMSVWNVHVNWFPVTGSMKYFKYHDGKFLIARHPKSSTENERTTVMIETYDDIKVVVRQIAGIVARRIENYVQEPDHAVQAGQEMGFIKFGSRLDVFLPLSTKINVTLGQKVKGALTPIAHMMA